VCGALQDFNSAAQALPSPQPAAPSDAQAMQDVKGALDAFVADIDAKLAQLTLIRDSLDALQTALVTDRYVERSDTALTSVQSVATQLTETTVPAVVATLNSLQSGYEAAAPSMVGRGASRIDIPGVVDCCGGANCPDASQQRVLVVWCPLLHQFLMLFACGHCWQQLKAWEPSCEGGRQGPHWPYVLTLGQIHPPCFLLASRSACC
jgi:hypothetical protein